MKQPLTVRIDTNDPGKAANVAARAAILFARVSGYIAENAMRENSGYQVAYSAESFESAIEEMFPELQEPDDETP